MSVFAPQLKALEQAVTRELTGRVEEVTGLTLGVAGFPAAVGSMCRVLRRQDGPIDAQVIGFRERRTLLMPLEDARGVSKGDRVVSGLSSQRVEVGQALLGRVVNGMGRPLDGRPAPELDEYYPLYAPAPPAKTRRRINAPLATGVRAIDGLLTAGLGQRLGIFSGTGVGKSVLLGMVARNTAADVIVLALVGERGREVRDFLAKELGEAGLARSVVVVSTSDESPVLRVRACFLATAVAEYFRDRGRNVLLLMDSLTRVAMAQRQMGLAAGEPPTTKGYTPSVFAMLPQLLERSGRTEQGSITGFYSVLVEGDDITEPVSDAVRGILDGHVWLSRALANRRHYPAIGVLESISRVMIDVVPADQFEAARRVSQLLATWNEIEDLVSIGAYAPGTNPGYDLAIQAKPRIDAFLRQKIDEKLSFERTRADLLVLHQEILALEKRLTGSSAATVREGPSGGV